MPEEVVYPDPSTGRCPEPSVFTATHTDLEIAAAITAHLTELEVAGDYDRLYAWMHPDAQAVVPQVAMEGWYRDVFSANPPVAFLVDDVRLGEWTWNVTGTQYPSAAEVSFRQKFEDGQEVPGTMQLVRDNGVWRWFFGRSREFVEEQVARNAPGARASAPASYAITDLGTGNGNWSIARRISDKGEVLWTWGTLERRDVKEFVVDAHEMMTWDGGEIDLGLVGAESPRDAGRADASSPLPELDYPSLPQIPGYRLFTHIFESETGLGAGTAYPSDGGGSDWRAFVFADGQVTVLDPAPGGMTSVATDLNDAGQLVAHPGIAGSGGFLQPGRAFLYDVSTRTMIDLDTLPGDDDSAANATNNLGQVVGFSQRLADGVIEKRAFLYDHRTGAMTDLNDVISSDSGWKLLEATDINDAGQIVGSGLIAGETHAFVLKPIH